MYEHGHIKFPRAGLLQSSEARGWRGVAAELRSHPAGELPPFVSKQMEITQVVRTPASGRVIRRGDGRQQDTRTLPGTLWLCPAGVTETAIRMTEPLPEVLHVYLPEKHFAAISLESGGTAAAADINYVAGLRDDLVREISSAILVELRAESSGGQLLIETLGLALAARLVQHHSSAVAVRRVNERRRVLEGARLRRVLDYIDDNFEAELSIVDLASVACLSRFHFARAFRDATGAPPHRYVSNRRLKHAQFLLTNTERSIADISMACGFSSQANFTRAFGRAIGATPGCFRRLRANS